jgi:guanine deaminase
MIGQTTHELAQVDVNSSKIIRGTWLCPHPSQPQWTSHQDAVLICNEKGQIIDFFEANLWETKYPHHPRPPKQHPEGVWLPGFIDTHVHYPQTAIIGSASGPLLDWLDTSVFPEESKFTQAEYAAYIATRFCDNLLKNGTTSAAVFSSSHVQATHLLFNEFAVRGLNGELGLTLMDRGAPDAVLCPADQAIAGCEQLIDTWHGYDDGRLNFCVTPRFGLSCTPNLLKEAGKLAQKYTLMVQTHISENRAELTATAEAFPESKDYLGVYEDLGLLHERSLFAHCIWLTDDEWTRFANAKAAVAHCPDSNFFLGSGQMSLADVQSRRIKLGLGSDVGAGRSFSMRKACARAYDASRITQSETTPESLLWHSTRGGALALNKPLLGVIEKGAYADVVCIKPPPSFDVRPTAHHRSPLIDRSLQTLIAQLIFCEDWDGVLEVKTRGISRWQAHL